MRLSIDHQTGFRYGSPVKSSYNEARMTPAATERQTLWTSRVSIEPAAWSFTHTDYWGTRVTTFELHEPHETLTVQAQAVVETRGDDLDWDTQRRTAPADLGWSAMRDRGVIDTMTEYLTVSDRTSPTEELAALAAHAAAGAPPRLAGLAVCELVQRRLRYQKGSTRVTSTAAEVWELGAGVCQDYSHVALGGLRSIGLPASYVSGYLHPGSAGAGARVSGESHSWIEWWCGTWVAYDPTQGRRLTDRYVRVGHGRDYGDVAPLRGTYSGGSSSMFVTVEMTELG